MCACLVNVNYYDLLCSEKNIEEIPVAAFFVVLCNFDQIEFTASYEIAPKSSVRQRKYRMPAASAICTLRFSPSAQTSILNSLLVTIAVVKMILDLCGNEKMENRDHSVWRRLRNLITAAREK